MNNVHFWDARAVEQLFRRVSMCYRLSFNEISGKSFESRKYKLGDTSYYLSFQFGQSISSCSLIGIGGKKFAGLIFADKTFLHKFIIYMNRKRTLTDNFPLH